MSAAVPVDWAAISSKTQALISTERARRLLVLGVVLLALLLRLYGAFLWNSYRPDSPARLVGDEAGYDNTARELLEGYGFTWPGRVPLYPLWLAGVYLVGDGSYQAVPYVQAFVGAFTVFLTFLLGRELFGYATGLLAAFAAAFSYTLVHQGYHLLSEALYTPAVLLVMLSLWHALQRRQLRWFALAGFTVGVSVLIRPALALFPVVLIVLLWYVLRGRQAVWAWIVYGAVAGLVLLPWLAHNNARHGAPILQTSNAILWQGSPEYYRLVHDEGYTYIRIWTEVLYGPGWQEHNPNSIEGEAYWRQRALASIQAEPLLYLRFAAEKLFTYWVGDPNADWGDSAIFDYQALLRIGFIERDAIQVILSRALPLAALAAAFLLRRQWRRLLPLYFLLGYFTLLHAATHAEVRLSEPLQPFLIVITAGAIVSLARPSLQSGTGRSDSFFTERAVYLYDLLHEMVVRDMKLRYKRSFLGTLWSLINPLAQMLVLNFIFSVVLPVRIPNFTVFLFVGVLVWGWFRAGLSSATGSIVANDVLIRRPGFPVAVLPIVTVTTHLVHFLLALPILFLFIWLADIVLTPVALLLPLVIALQFLLILSLAYFVASIHVTFRDTQYLLDIALLLGFYLSPIFYEPETVPAPFQLVYNLNPMVHIISAYRDILMYGTLPPLFPLLLVALASVVLLTLGYGHFMRASYRFVEEL